MRYALLSCSRKMLPDPLLATTALGMQTMTPEMLPICMWLVDSAKLVGSCMLATHSFNKSLLTQQVETKARQAAFTSDYIDYGLTSI